MSPLIPFGEAIVLGLASGPACIASCGPVLVPSLLAEREGVKLNTRYLCAFLGTRLAGYLLFAFAAWQVGAMTLPPAMRVIVFGVVHVLLAAVLLWYARSVGKSCASTCERPRLVTIAPAGKHGIPGAAVLGLLTGISLCPPFVAAGMRAAELASPAAALIFFAIFFVGTSIWFVPFVGLGCLRRNEAITTVARMAMVLIALYYGYTGLTILVGGKIHG